VDSANAGPLVTVITCFLNEERFLAEAVESVLAQTMPAWELLLVDDGSSDGGTALAAEYAARHPDRIRYLEHEGHATRGLAASRELGLGHARGRFVHFLDADDWILPTHLEQLTDALGPDLELEVAYCGWTYVTPEGQEAFGMFAEEGGDLFEPHASYCVSIVHTYLVSRALVQSVGGFDTSLGSCEDWDLWLRVARTGARFGVVRDKLAAYRIRRGSMTSSGSRILADGLEVLRRGHAPDPRVPRQHPAYPEGLPPEGLAHRSLDLLCSCAGFEIGGGRDARTLFPLLPPESRSPLDPWEVARSVTIHALVATGRPRHDWPALWPELSANVESFLSALEAHSGCRGLARDARALCRHLVASTRWSTDFPLHPPSRRARLATRLRSLKDRFATGGGRGPSGLASSPGA
jgi:hypothetical protein